MTDSAEFPERSYPASQMVKQIGNRSIVIFLTVCTKGRAKILASESIHSLLQTAWKEADSWFVGRYVILPDHIHLFVSPSSRDAPGVKNWVRFWKTVTTKSWPTDRDGSVWQRDCWDRQLRSGDSYSQKWEYVRNNPVRHGLVERAEDWPFQGELNELNWHD
jgi:putative transposase